MAENDKALSKEWQNMEGITCDISNENRLNNSIC